MGKVYLYLARRDKKGVKVMAILNGPEIAAGRLADLKKLALPPAMEQQVEQQIYADRMLWEPWLESAESFADLKRKMKDRGYTSLPLCSSPLFAQERESIVSSVGQLEYKPTIKAAEKGKKTMLRKLKD